MGSAGGEKPLLAPLGTIFSYTRARASTATGTDEVYDRSNRSTDPTTPALGRPADARLQIRKECTDVAVAVAVDVVDEHRAPPRSARSRATRVATNSRGVIVGRSRRLHERMRHAGNRSGWRRDGARDGRATCRRSDSADRGATTAGGAGRFDPPNRQMLNMRLACMDPSCRSAPARPSVKPQARAAAPSGWLPARCARRLWPCAAAARGSTRAVDEQGAARLAKRGARQPTAACAAPSAAAQYRPRTAPAAGKVPLDPSPRRTS